MTNRCPECGCRDLKLSQRKGLGEHARGLLGYYPVRCPECKFRFEIGIWNKRLFRYAHCPKCLRMDLSRWNLDHYIVPFWTRFKLNIGAQPFRCETCRCNFASFRPRRERFSWRKHRERGLAAAARNALAAPADPERVNRESDDTSAPMAAASAAPSPEPVSTSQD